ncbi:MAG: type transport system permease protein [Bacillota bacterium]|nr:type transport system permease protein [Bacillota bacterium]
MKTGSIVRYTWREALRKRLVMLVAVLTIGFLVLFGWGVHQVLGLPGQVDRLFIRAAEAAALLNIGLYFASFLTAFLTIVMTSGAIAGEVESGTIYAVLARPLSRRAYVLGRFGGFLFLSLFYATALYLSMLLIVRPYLPLFASDVLASLGIFLLQPLVLCALALAASASFSTLNAGVLLVSLYAFGVVGGLLEQIGAGLKREVLTNIGIFASLVMPADALFRKALFELFATLGQLVRLGGGPFFTAPEPSTAMLLWAVFYAAVAVGLALYKFERQDL